MNDRSKPIFEPDGKNSIHDGVEHEPTGGKGLIDSTDTALLSKRVPGRAPPAGDETLVPPCDDNFAKLSSRSVTSRARWKNPSVDAASNGSATRKVRPTETVALGMNPAETIPWTFQR